MIIEYIIAVIRHACASYHYATYFYAIIVIKIKSKILKPNNYIYIYHYHRCHRHFHQSLIQLYWDWLLFLNFDISWTKSYFHLHLLRPAHFLGKLSVFIKKHFFQSEAYLLKQVYLIFLPIDTTNEYFQIFFFISNSIFPIFSIHLPHTLLY